MIKDTKISAKKTQKNAKTLSEIGLYNQKVSEFLDNNPLTPIAQHAIKNFNDTAQRNRLTDDQYNQAVEEFNNAHGLILLKKGNIYNDTKYYSYINYPYLDTKAIKATMDNYRAYVYQYNKQAEKINQEIRDYNQTQVINHYSLTEAQKKRKMEFIKANNSLFVWEYNKVVELENKKDPIIPKRRVAKVITAIELTFQVLVHFYTSQLRERNAYLRVLNRPTSTLKNSLPKLRLNQKNLADHTMNGIPRFDFVKRTAKNHVKRLREAGILVNYKKINTKQPIQVNFNRNILVILDGNPPKSQTPNFKGFNTSIKKSLHDNRELDYINLKLNKIRDCAKSTDLNKSGSKPENYVAKEFYGKFLKENFQRTEAVSTPCARPALKNSQDEKNSPGPAEIQKILPGFLKKSTKSTQNKGHVVLTENFLSRIEDEKKLAQKLADGQYNYYTPLPYSYLERVANYGAISFDDFKTVLIQDFIKSAAKIWRNHTVFAGSWKNAINMIKTQIFVRVQSKEALIENLKQYRWRINWARNWFAQNTDIKALFPSLYFEKNRTESCEIGFAGTRRFWLKNLAKKKQLAKKNKEANYNANKRKRRKLEEALKKYQNGQYTHKQLFNYVQNNLPHRYLEVLRHRLDKNKFA